MKKVSLAELSGKYVGRKFSDCTCMAMAYGWYTDLGIEVPYEFDGLNVDTYFHAWQIDKKTTLDTMIRLFKTLGKAAQVDDLKRHDLLVVQEKGNLYAAIYLGGGMAITSHIAEGVKTFYLGKLHQVVLARRLL